MYIGAFGAAEPADTSVASAPDGAVWTDLGGTSSGVTITIDQTYKELDVDQIVDVPGRRLTKREVTLKTMLAEPTLENLLVAVNLSVGLQTGTGFKALEPTNDTSATQPTYRALIFDGIAPGGGNRRVIARKVLSDDKIAIDYAKDKQSGWSVQFATHYVSPSVRPYKVIDAA